MFTQTMLMWMGITFVLGIALLVVEYSMSSKKREGFTPADRRRCVDIFWFAVFGSLFVGALIWAIEQLE